MTTLPKGWTLAHNRKTNRYAVRNPGGILIKWIAPHQYEGGTKKQAVDFAVRSAKELAAMLKASAREEKRWVKA